MDKMCGRFAIGINLQELPSKLNESVIHGSTYLEEGNNNNGNGTYQFIDDTTNKVVEVTLTNFKSYNLSFNVAPTSSAFILYMKNTSETNVKEKYIVEASRFGLVPTWKKPKEINSVLDNKSSELLKDMRAEQAKYFNCRKETLSQPRSIWNDSKNRRCVVPIQGYFEWQKDSKQRSPYFICSKNAPFIYLTGLYSHNTNYSVDEFNDQLDVLSTFTIITGPANSDDIGDLSWLHPRKPILLEPGSKEWYDWLNPTKKFEDSFFETCLNTKKNTAYSNIKSYRVSKDVGRTSSQGEYLIKEVKEEQKSITSFFSKGVKRDLEADTKSNTKKAKSEENLPKKDITSFFNIKQEK